MLITRQRDIGSARVPWRILGVVAAGVAGIAAAWVLLRRSAFLKVSESDVDPEVRASAERLGTSLLTAWREDRFEELGEEATERMRWKLDAAAQREGYVAIKDTFGDFESMEYVETWKPRNGAPLRIHRFRGTFSGHARPEIRVVMDEGKLSGFWVKPWETTVR